MHTDSLQHPQLRGPHRDEFLLLCIMASNNPAFSSYQKQMLHQSSNTWTKAGISEHTVRLLFLPCKLTSHPKTRSSLSRTGLFPKAGRSDN